MISLLLWLSLAVAQDLPTFGTAPTMTPEQVGQALGGPAAALAAGNVGQAGDQLFAIVGNPSLAPAHGAAWAMLAGLYEKQGLTIPAVTAWARAIELDPQANASKVVHAAELSTSIGDDADLAPVLGNNLALATDPAARNALARIAGRYHLRQGNYGPALGALMMADKSAPGFVEVELLRGIVLAQQRRFADAVPPLLTARNDATKAS